MLKRVSLLSARRRNTVVDKQQQEFLATSVGDYYFKGTGVSGPVDPDSYGIEIEMEGLGPDHEGFRPPNSLPWQAVADGSLRDGIEFISRGGRPYSSLSDDLDALQAYLTKKEFTPVFSYRTSVHVHMNAFGLSFTNIFTLFTLYTIFEAPMIAFGGEERCGNVHCLPVSHAGAVIDAARNACYNVPVAEQEQRLGGGRANWAHSMQNLVSNDRRYASFNWASLPSKGTVEFRSHRGTMDKAEITAWVNVIHSLKLAAVRYKSPSAVVQAFSSMGLESFTADVFGELAPSFVEFSKGFDRQMWEGMRLAQHVAFARSDWPAPKVVKEKKLTGREAQVIVDEEWDPRGVDIDAIINANRLVERAVPNPAMDQVNWAQFMHPLQEAGVRRNGEMINIAAPARWNMPAPQPFPPAPQPAPNARRHEQLAAEARARLARRRANHPEEF